MCNEDIVLDVHYELYCSEEDQVAIKLFIISLIKIKVDMSECSRNPTSLSKLFGSVVLPHSESLSAAAA